MAKHRKKCGITSRLTPGQILIKNEEKDETVEKVHIIESVNVGYSGNEDQNAVNTIYWATDEQCGSDQQHVLQVEVEKVHHSASVEMVHQIQEKPNDPRSDRMDSRKSSIPSSIKKISRRSTNSSLLDANLSRFIIGCNLSFDIVDSSHFKRFANSMNADCEFHDGTAISVDLIKYKITK